MIQLNESQGKVVYFSLIIEGIEKSKLDFTFRILADGIEYGIPGTFENDRVKIEIPPINSFMADRHKDLFDAKLEVTGDNKYYMKPWSDKIQIISEPKVEAQIIQVDSDVIKEEVKVKVKLDKMESVKEVKPVKVKKTKFGTLLQDK